MGLQEPASTQSPEAAGANLGWSAPREFISRGYVQPVGPINTNLMLGNIVTFNEHYCKAQSIIVLRPFEVSETNLAYLTNIGHYLEGKAYFRQLPNCCDRITVKTEQSWLQSAPGVESLKVFADKSVGRRLDGLVGLLAQL